MKFSSQEEIQKKYNYKIGAAKKWLTTQLKQREEWTNRRVNKKKDDSWEKMRQKCMELAQVNCRMREALDQNSITIRCCSCDRLYNWWDLSGWHRHSRSIQKTCVDLVNINPQCDWCNWSFGKQEKKKIEEEYNKYIIQKHWQQAFNKLKRDADDKKPFSKPLWYWEWIRAWYQEEHNRLKEQIKSLWFQKK